MRTPLAWHIFGEHYLYANESNEQAEEDKKPKVLQMRETLKSLFAVDDDFVMRIEDNDQRAESFWYTIQTDTVLAHPFVYSETMRWAITLEKPNWLNGRKCASRVTQMSVNLKWNREAQQGLHEHSRNCAKRLEHFNGVLGNV